MPNNTPNSSHTVTPEAQSRATSATNSTTANALDQQPNFTTEEFYAAIANLNSGTAPENATNPLVVDQDPIDETMSSFTSQIEAEREEQATKGSCCTLS